MSSDDPALYIGLTLGRLREKDWQALAAKKQMERRDQIAEIARRVADDLQRQFELIRKRALIGQQ